MFSASFSSFSSSPMDGVGPMAVMRLRISLLPSILSVRVRSTFKILPRRGKMAWKRGSRPCLAEPPAESPSTINSSDSSGFLDWQSASLPGREWSDRAPLAPHQLLGLAGGLAGPGGVHGLFHDGLGVFGILLEMDVHGLEDHLGHNGRPLRSCPIWSWSGPRTAVWGSLTEMTAVSPSRTSSPVSFCLNFLGISAFSI